MRKKKLSIEDQVNHMKNSGIKFSIIDEKSAIDYLTNNTYYFKLKAFAKNYQKNKNNKYINLEFAYLVELAKIDMHFRNLILSISLQIEHYLKVVLNKNFSKNNKEDGYNIVQVFYNWKNKGNSINNFEPHKSPYVKDMVDKYQNDFALWNIIEVLTFGDLVGLCECYSDLYGNIVDNINKKEFKNMLFISKQLRNACAHSNCLLSNLNDSVNTINCDLNSFIIKNLPEIGLNARKNNLKRRIVNDFLVLLQCMDAVITSKEVKDYLLKEAKFFIKRAYMHIDYFDKNNTIISVLRFLKKVIDYYCNKCI